MQKLKFLSTARWLKKYILVIQIPILEAQQFRWNIFYLKKALYSVDVFLSWHQNVAKQPLVARCPYENPSKHCLIFN